MIKIKQLEKCKHPNSRRTKALAKQLKKQNSKGKAKLAANIKQNMIGEKLLWFKDNLNPESTTCTPMDVENLICKYLARFDEELEQIKIKHSIGQRKNRQHASREDIINMTLQREKEEFKTCGIEMPDLLNDAQLAMLKAWTGELRFLQNFKLRRFSIKFLRQGGKTDRDNNDSSKLDNENNEVTRDLPNERQMEIDS